MSIKHWISQHAASTPDKAAIHFMQNGEQQPLSYAELEQAIQRKVGYFRNELNLQKGDRIAWYGMNNPQMLVLLFAAARCELILVPLNWRLALPEVTFIIQDCAPRALFFDHHFAGNVPELLASASGYHAIPVNDEAAGIYPGDKTKQLASPPGDEPESIQKKVSSNDPQTKYTETGKTPLMIIYTSGTGGHPKGAVLDQNSFECNAKMSWHMHDMTADDHILSFLPMFHVGGFNIQMLPALALGATTTLLERFDPTAVVRALNTGDTTLTLCVPTMLRAFLAHPEWNPDKLHNVRSMSIGSTDVPVALIRALHNLNIPLLQVYGTTETSPLAIYQRAQNAFHSEGSIGQCGQLCEIRLMDSDGHQVAPGQNGEVWVKGDNILCHYWNNPEATQSTMINGWFRSGDVARCDENGFYWFTDRLKHVIISGGENIYAAELERVIRDFPGLQELIIVGKPDPKWGEVPVVVAIRDESDASNNSTDDQLSADILAAFNGKLARYKHPKAVIFVQTLPRTALGKIQSDKVKALIT